MIPAGVKGLVASHPVDFRKGPDGLLALVRDAGSDSFLCVGRDYVGGAALTPSRPAKRSLPPPHKYLHAAVQQLIVVE